MSWASAPLVEAGCGRGPGASDGTDHGLHSADVRHPDATARGASSPSTGPTAEGKDDPGGAAAAHLAGAGAGRPDNEPGGTWLGERIRELLLERTRSTGRDLLTDAMLFNAARRQLVRRVDPTGGGGGQDRHLRAFRRLTLAYQGYGAGLGRPCAGYEIATDGLWADLTLFLDLPVEAGLARKAPADITRFEAEFDLAFHDVSAPASWRWPPPSRSDSGHRRRPGTSMT